MSIEKQSNFIKGETTLLHYIAREPKVQLTKKAPLILLLHGVGSNEKDLFRYADALPPEFLVISARAPYILGEGSYGWYQVDLSGGQPLINKEQSEKSRIIIIQFINQLREMHEFNESEIYLCGFSQGAIMSYNVALTRPDRIKGIAVLSGRLPEELKTKISSAPELKNLNVLISHGVNDAVLNVEFARLADRFLKQKGIKTYYREYNGGHQITGAMLNDLVSWLNATNGNKIFIN